jgi:hypothetical protein
VETLEKRILTMRVLPETATRKLVERRWPGYVLAALGLAALVLVAVALLRDESFSPGEELYAPGFEGVAVSTRDTSYPASDVLRFDRGPEVVYVYLAVEDLPEGRNLEARIERSGQQSALTWLLAGGDGLEISDGGEEHLRPSGGGVSGVVQFAIRAESGGPLPGGNYTVSVYGSEGGDAAVRKYFVIRD